MEYPSLDYKKGGFKISGPCKAAARSKFDVYPSAYANAWGVRCTKAGGPGNMGKSKKNAGGMKEFEPHMMYDPKTGKGVKANTYEKHLSLKKKGYDQRKRRMGGTTQCRYGC